MAIREAFFKPAPQVLGGYYIPVRNDWNNKISRRHISENEKELYEQQFGEEILNEDEFFKWWKNNHQSK
ncbi:MAG: hypothetical protein A2X13_00145 [Bacteroidetes bacterium GWC2_33_15]|nr:MAG: hypothetical protein A2X10_03955 [Bacteroidetes bacterium GWA2_33_15]OFX51036.1 MAG: hypothetical protein A2X13_00145 [Bacteroidetes bacterium GWC2_33_15]OFX65659.1 MAG: hypothetical protein A2X15_13765 [Bacteroidetes bacterium GWB2_32_14]OFX70244.1 MAG: hypothetical protein A2X14_03035 [Bacteroidetes bacterium GWD2_33_33]HAN17240.1 hypothetical protein [Bacteroidales bacterium]